MQKYRFRCLWIIVVFVASALNAQSLSRLTPVSTESISWTIIDSLQNSYSTALPNVTPIAYDPFSQSVVIVYRGKSTYATNGSIMYAYRQNSGAWKNRIGPMQGGKYGNTNGCFPSVVLSNPAHAASRDSVCVVGVWPMVVHEQYGGMMYSIDPGIGVNQPIPSSLDTSSTWDNRFAISAAHNSSDIIVTGTTNRIYVYRSTDGLTFAKTAPAVFDSTKFYNVDDVFSICYRNTAFFLGVNGVFASDTSLYTFGISQSSNRGATWSALETVNWKSIPGLTDFQKILGTMKMAVDANNGIHVISVFVDTVSSYPVQQWKLFDVYKPFGGVWRADKITDLPPHENWKYGELDQTLIENEYSISVDGKILVAKWLQDDRGAQYKDSSAMADIYKAVWNTTSSIWSSASNLTATPSLDEQLTHISPVLGKDNNFHLLRVMEAGNNRPVGAANSAILYYGTGGTVDYPYLAIGQPQGGEIWDIGTVNKIEWNSENLWYFDLDYSTDGGNTWLVLAPYTSVISMDSYDWTIPNTPSTQCKIRIRAGGYSSATAVSNGLFTIRNSSNVQRDNTADMPAAYFLSDNYPNPFNGTTTFEFGIRNKEKVKIMVFDLLGRAVAAIVDETMAPGRYSVRWSSALSPSGIYYCIMYTDHFTAIKKMILVK